MHSADGQHSEVEKQSVYQLVYRMIEWACCGVILQHIPYIFFCESCHFIELWIQRVIGADVESAGQVVHG